MQLTEKALRTLIFLGEDDTWNHQPLHHEIVKRAREAGLAGATVLHGCEGFGTTSRIHTDEILSLTEDLPIVVIIVDTEDKSARSCPSSTSSSPMAQCSSTRSKSSAAKGHPEHDPSRSAAGALGSDALDSDDKTSQVGNKTPVIVLLRSIDDPASGRHCQPRASPRAPRPAMTRELGRTDYRRRAAPTQRDPASGGRLQRHVSQAHARDFVNGTCQLLSRDRSVSRVRCRRRGCRRDPGLGFQRRGCGGTRGCGHGARSWRAAPR